MKGKPEPCSFNYGAVPYLCSPFISYSSYIIQSVYAFTGAVLVMLHSATEQPCQEQRATAKCVAEKYKQTL